MLLTAMAFAACSNENDIVNPKTEPQQPASDGITFTAVFGVKNGTTRALSDPGDGTLKASWEVGEKIAIVFNNQVTRAEVSSVDDEGNATVTATLPSGTPNNQAVLYIYPADCAWNGGLRSGIGEVQTGTLYGQFGLNRYDLAIAEGTLVVDGETAQPNGTVTLVNQFAMCKFQFKDENDQVIRDIAKLVITDLSTTRKITVTTPSPMEYVYVAMNPSNNSMKFELETESGKDYQKIASAHLEAGMFYRPTFKMTFFEPPLKTPLTFEAKEAGAIVVFSAGYYSNAVLECRINDGEWTEYTSTDEITLENVGDKVSFRGDNHGTEGEGLGRYYCTAPCYLYGNVMSLLYKENFATATTLPRNYIFYNLFAGSEESPRAIYSHPTKDLLLPATTLTEECYSGMFEYTCLTRAPELPAETLAKRCYWCMFLGCTSLTTAPKLPSETLAEGCYSRMFEGCTSLTKAPVLPAPTMVDDCYYNMFKGCSSLNEVECLATSFGSYSTYKWLDGVSSTGTFTKATGATWQTGASGIPEGWTVVEK